MTFTKRSGKLHVQLWNRFRYLNLLRANMHRLQLQTEKQMLYKLYFNNDDISSAVIRIVDKMQVFVVGPKWLTSQRL